LVRTSSRFFSFFRASICLRGVNEWLTIRNLDLDFFKWLPICRDGDRPGSGGGGVATSSGGGAARKRQNGGNGTFAAAVVFSPQGANGKKMLGVPKDGEGFGLLAGSGSLRAIRLLYQEHKFLL
jgi:hypothetical protein